MHTLYTSKKKHDITDSLHDVLQHFEKNLLEEKSPEVDLQLVTLQHNFDAMFKSLNRPSQEKEMSVLMEDKTTPRSNTSKQKKHKDVETSEETKKAKTLKNYKEMKTQLRSLAPIQPAKMGRNKKKRFCLKWLIKTLFGLSFILTTLRFVLREPTYTHSFCYVKSSHELEKRVYGQDQVVKELSKYLQLDKPLFKFIGLVGGTGVGKSYTTEIIKVNYPYNYRIRQYFSPIKITMNDIVLPFYYPRLIILENLKEYDLLDVAHFLNTRDSVPDDQYITVIAVFNIEIVNDKLERKINFNQSLRIIENFFVKENINAKIIPYDFLSREAIGKCIMDAANDSDIIISNEQVDIIIEKTLNDNIGCKGIYGKVQIIGRQ